VAPPPGFTFIGSSLFLSLMARGVGLASMLLAQDIGAARYPTGFSKPARELFQRQPRAGFVVLRFETGRQVLAEEGDLGSAPRRLERHDDRHLAAEGRVVGDEGDRLDDTARRIERDEADIDHVLPFGSLAAEAPLVRRVEERHPVAAADAGVEGVDLPGHLGGRKPLDENRRIHEGGVERLRRCPDDARCAGRGAVLLFAHGVLLGCAAKRLSADCH
jgi:hypothetical protein